VDAVEEAEDVADEAVEEAVEGAVVEDDQISPLPNPKKTTNEASLGNRTPIIQAQSVGTHQHKELWLLPNQKSPQMLEHRIPHTSSKAIRMMMTDRKP
jgi:hypothetical protein